MKISPQARGHLLVVALLLPALALVSITIAYPIAGSAWLSLNYFSMYHPENTRFVGLQNFIDLSRDPVFIASWSRSFYVLAVALTIEMFGGMGLALLLNTDLKGQRIYRSIILIPMIVSPVVAGISWKWILYPGYGIVKYLFATVGLPEVFWLTDPFPAMNALAIVDVWQWTPFVCLLTLSGLQSLPREPFEAARLDGASKWKIFWLVTLPMLKSVLVVALLIRSMLLIRMFDVIYSLTSGGPARATELVGFLAWRVGMREYSLGYGAAMAMVILAFTVIMSAIIMIVGRERK